MAKVGKKKPKNTPSEERVKNAVVGHIASQGYAKDLVIKANDEHGVDISAKHRTSTARRIFIEAKGHSGSGNKTLAIEIAWGQLCSRVTAVNRNRIHGLAFPSSWETNVSKLSSRLVASYINCHFYFVSDGGNVSEYTAVQFAKKHKK